MTDPERAALPGEGASRPDVVLMPREVLVGLVGNDPQWQELLAAWDHENELRRNAEVERDALQQQLDDNREFADKWRRFCAGVGALPKAFAVEIATHRMLAGSATVYERQRTADLEAESARLRAALRQLADEMLDRRDTDIYIEDMDEWIGRFVLLAGDADV